MKHDKRRTTVALQLQKHETIGCNLNRWEINIYVCSALRTTHLILDARENLVESMGIEVHRFHYNRRVDFDQHVRH
jgi:hypothetical protein